MLRWQYRTNYPYTGILLYPYTVILLYCYTGTVPRTKVSWVVCERGTLEADEWKMRYFGVVWHSKVTPAKYATRGFPGCLISQPTNQPFNKSTNGSHGSRKNECAGGISALKW